MSAFRYVLKVLGTHIVAVIVMAIMMLSLLLLLQDNMWYQVAVSFVLAIFYWVIMCFSLERDAVYDAKKGLFDIKKMVIAAAVLNVPNVLFIVLELLGVGGIGIQDFFKLLFRYWNAGYINFFILTKDSLWIRLIISLLYFPGLMLAYYRGMLIKKKEDRMIESMKNEAPSRKNDERS